MIFDEARRESSVGRWQPCVTKGETLNNFLTIASNWLKFSRKVKKIAIHKYRLNFLSYFIYFLLLKTVKTVTNM